MFASLNDNVHSGRFAVFVFSGIDAAVSNFHDNEILCFVQSSKAVCHQISFVIPLVLLDSTTFQNNFHLVDTSFHFLCRQTLFLM